MSGVLEAICLAPAACAPMVGVAAAELCAGRGIAGDRYEHGAGTFSDWPRDHELTLVEAEVLEDVAADWDLTLSHETTRRNLLTRGISLNPLVGKRFRVGGVLCEGTRLCEPCAHLEVVTGIGGLARILAGRGGLRALVLENGPVKTGDPITLENP